MEFKITKEVKFFLSLIGLLTLLISIPLSVYAVRQEQVYLARAGQTCAEIASGYDYYLCSSDSATGFGCGEGTRATNCYYGIQVTKGTDCDPNYCRYYNFTRNCGSNKTECEARCTASGCVTGAPAPTPTPTKPLPPSPEEECYGPVVGSLPRCPGEPWEVCYQNKTYHCFADNGVWGWHVRVPHARGTLGPCNVSDCHLYEYPAGQWGSGCCNPETGMLVAASNCKGLSCDGEKACDGFGHCVSELPEDTTAPTISNVSASNIMGTSARISWETNEDATSRVIYGLAEPWPQQGTSTLEDRTYKKYHSVSLSSLTPGMNYKFNVQSKDAAGNLATSADYSFKTSGVPPTPTLPPGVTPTLTPVAEGASCVGMRLYAQKKTGGIKQETSSIYFDLDVVASNPTKEALEFKVETIKPSGVKVTNTSGSMCTGKDYCTWNTFDCKYFGCAWAGIPYPETCQCPEGTYQVTAYVNGKTSPACKGSVYVGSTTGDEYDTFPEPPVISGVNIQVSGTTATASWKTDIEATGKVRYGKREGYRYDSAVKYYCRGFDLGVYGKRVEQPNLATNHQVTITNLPTDVSYPYFLAGWCFKIEAWSWAGDWSSTAIIEYSTSGDVVGTARPGSLAVPPQAQKVDFVDDDMLDLKDFNMLVLDYYGQEGQEGEDLPGDLNLDLIVNVCDLISCGDDYLGFFDIYPEWAGIVIPSE